MSYEHLAGRLIETQRSLLGQRAVDIAQSVDGLSVTDDGTVADVADEDREVLAALVDEYTAVLGQPAESRFRAAISEFEDEVVLPENLGGPTDPPTADSDGADEAAGAADADTDGVAGSQQLVRPAAKIETVVEYSTPPHTNLTEDIDATDDLASVYVVTEDEHGCEWRLPVEDAILNAVTSVTDISVEEVDALQEYVDTGVFEAAPGDDGTNAVSLEIEGHRVELQPHGDVHIA